MTIQKAELPPSARNHGKVNWEEAVRLMRQAPREWHLIGDFSPGVATHIRNGLYKAFLYAETADPAAFMRKHWEIAARVKVRGQKRVNLYGRWLG